MAYVLSSVSGNLISAASAGYAPTNSGDVSAIASAYQVVSATATQLYAGTAYVTSINEAPISAARAGNAANAVQATSAWYDGTGRLISSLPDSAAVSGIASAYAESAASGKQDALTFGYDGDNKISSIDGSALAGGGGGGAVSSPYGTIIVEDGERIEATNSAIGTTTLEASVTGSANAAASTYYVGGYQPLYMNMVQTYGIGLTFYAPNYASVLIFSAETEDGGIVETAMVLPGASSAYVKLSSSPVRINQILLNYSSQYGWSLNLSGTNPVLFMGPGITITSVKELAWKDDVVVSSLGLTGTSVSSINGMSVYAPLADSAWSAYQSLSAQYDNKGRHLSALASIEAVPTGIVSPYSTIFANKFTADTTNSAVCTAELPGATVVLGSASETFGENSPLVFDIPTASPDTELLLPIQYGANSTISAVFDGITATAIATGWGTSMVNIEVPYATSVSVYADSWRSLNADASAVIGSSIAVTSVGELAWASAIPTYQYDAEDKISAINGSAIAGGAGGGVDSATVSAIASSYAESAVSSKADSSALSSYALSADVSGTVDLVSTQSANWGGSALALSAGPGVKLEKVGNTLVASTDETVLWSGNGYSVGDVGQTFNLSETPLNFSTVKIYGYRPLSTGSSNYHAMFSDELDIKWLADNSANQIMISYSINNGNQYIGGMGLSGITSTTWKETGGFHYPVGGSKSLGEYAHVHKVVGINRTSEA